MNEYENHTRHIARHFVYPATPTLRGQWRKQRSPHVIGLRRAMAMVAVLMVVVMVTPLRAAILEFLQIGAVTIIFGEPPTEAPTLPSLLDLFGETTLEQAMRQVSFPLRLPAGFDPPDRVYYQNDSVITIWEADGNSPTIALYHLGQESYGKVLSVGHNTQVGGQPAIWTEVPHPLEYLQNGDEIVQRQTVLVTGHVLVWQTDEVTYRLESALSLEQAIALAESLQ